MARKASIRYSLVCCSTLAIGLLSSFVFPTDSYGQLVVRKPKPQKESVKTLSQQFIDHVKEKYHQETNADSLVEGIPEGLLTILKYNYDDSRKDTRDRIVARFRGYIAAFEAQWTKIMQRRAQVNAAVKQAKAQMAKKQYDTAQKTLMNVITPATISHQGLAERRKDLLLTTDVETEALAQLARLAHKANRPRMLPDIANAFLVRREIGDKASEMLRWLSYEAVKGSGNALPFYDGWFRNADPRRMLEMAGLELAGGFWGALPQYGLPKFSVPAHDRPVKRGRIILLELWRFPGCSLRVTEKRVTFRAKGVHQYRANCRQGSQLDSYDPVSKKFRYREVCDTKSERIDTSATILLRQPPPEWSKDLYRLWLVGKVVKKGPHWKLSEGEVVDFRFLLPDADLR